MEQLFATSDIEYDKRAEYIRCDCPNYGNMVMSSDDEIMSLDEGVYAIMMRKTPWSYVKYVDLGFRTFGCLEFKVDLNCVPMSLKDTILMMIIRDFFRFNLVRNTAIHMLLRHNFLNASKKLLYELVSRDLKGSVCEAKKKILLLWRIIEPDLYQTLYAPKEDDYYGFVVFDGNKDIYVRANATEFGVPYVANDWDDARVFIRNTKRILLEGVAEGKWEAFDDPNELILRGPF